MAHKPGSNESESPADNAELEVDAHPGTEDSAGDRNAEAVETTPATDPPPAEVADETETPPKPIAAKPKPSKPSPIDEAIERMTTPPEDADEPEPGARKATEGQPAKPKDDAATADPPATSDGQPNDKDEAKQDPLADWSPEERKHTKGKVKERYRKLHEENEQAKPFVEVGRGWSDFTQRHQLGNDLATIDDNEDALGVAIRTQAAALRVASAAREKREVGASDVALLRKNRDAIDQVLGLAGHKAPTAPAEDLSKVEVTQEVRDMQDAFGILKSEDELRAVQAALNRVRKPAGKPANEQVEKPITDTPAQPAAPAARNVPWTTHDEQVVKAAIREDLVKAGIPSDKIAGHFAAVITPLVSKRLQTLFPAEKPDAVWGNLSPSYRRELVAQAQSAWAAKAKPATIARPPRAPTPPPVQGTGSRPALAQRAATSGKGAVAATIAYLSGEETE